MRTSSAYQCYIGIDIASESFVVALLRPLVQEQHQFSVQKFANNPEGLQALQQWLSKQQVDPQQSIACMEATGVYSQAVLYELAASGYAVVLEAPQKVKRAMHPQLKTDTADARAIAEYAWRYQDQLRLWQAPQQVLEHIGSLLSAREHFLQQKQASMNMLTALKRKVVRTDTVEASLQKQIDLLSQQIKELQKQLRQQIDSNDHFRSMVNLATSVPGVGLLLAAQILLYSQGFEQPLSQKSLAAYLGICPFEHTSGKSVRRASSSRRRGPAPLRKLLYLASMSLRRNNADLKHYFQRKIAQGKPARLVLNNIANKLLKVLCAVLNSRRHYHADFRSLAPHGT